MRLTLEAAILNGDANFDPRAFNGLSKRLVPGGVQTVDNGGGTVKLTPIEQLVDTVNANGGEKVLITSKAGRRQISAACRDVGGTEWMTVEQEDYPDGKSPMECTAMSLAALKKIIADLKPA